MKRWMKRLLFEEERAVGAFFGLTLLGAGSYLACVVFLLLWANDLTFFCPVLPGWDDEYAAVCYWLPGVLLVLVLLYLFFFLRFLYGGRRRAVHGDWVRYFAVYAVAAAIAVSMAAAVIAGPAWLIGTGKLTFFFAIPVAVFFWYAPFAVAWFQCGRSLAVAGLSALSGGLGLLFWAAAVEHLFISMRSPFTWSSILSNGDEPLPLFSPWIRLPEVLHIRGSGWTWVFALALGLLLAGYLLQGRLLAGLAGVKFRRLLLGRGVLTLWGLAAAAWVTGGVLAFRADDAVARAKDALAVRFGRPLTAEALAAWYYAGRQPDAGGWARQKERHRALMEKVRPAFGENYRYARTIQLTPAEKVRHVAELAAMTPELNAFDYWMDQGIPKYPLNFQPGMLLTEDLPYLRVIFDAARINGWRLRLALEAGDRAAALAAWRRIGELGDDFQSGEVFLIGQLVAVAVENLHLDGLELLLESDRLGDDELRQAAAECKAVEERLDVMMERALYGEAVLGYDLLEGVFFGSVFTAAMLRDLRLTPDFSPLAPERIRFFCPYLWWFLRRDEARLLEAYHVPRLDQISDRVDSSAAVVRWMFIPGMNTAGKRFIMLQARLRAMRGLIAAELYYREHGRYPDRPDVLPDDPFGEGPLRYRVGEAEFTVMLPASSKAPDYPAAPFEKKVTVPAVQVWSVGPDGIDGYEANARSDQRRCDDVRALMRIRR
jgi:hypothetical protein